MDYKKVPTMMTSPITSMRESNPIMRVAAFTAMVTFTMMIMQPLAMAAQLPDAPGKSNNANSTAPGQQAASHEAKLSQAIQNVQKHLTKFEEKLKKRQDHQNEKALIKQLHQEIKGLDKDVMQKFAETKAHILKHKLSDTIMQRHRDAVTSFKGDMAALIDNLNGIETESDPTLLKDKVTKALEHVSSKQHRRAHQPFDPNNMPFKVKQPDEKNKPKVTREQFHAAGLYDRPLTQLAALGDFKFDQLTGADNPAYLAETDEVVLTDFVKAKAVELEHDPVKIYNFVRNNVEWLPTWGAMQDSDLTLGSLKGNAMDISSLLIALYRASGIPARYVHGTIDVPIDKFMNWAGGFTDAEAALRFAASGGIPLDGVITGGKVSHARMEHVWVEAAIDFVPSRGVKNKSADTWVQMDGGFKQHELSDGIDEETIYNVDVDAIYENYLNSRTFSEAESWISGTDFNIFDPTISQMRSDLESYLNSQTVQPTLRDVVGGKKTIIKDEKGFAGTLPHKLILRSGSYDKIPSQMQHHVSIQFGSGSSTSNGVTVTLPYAKVNNQKVTLSAKPATQEDENLLHSFLPDSEVADLSQLSFSFPGYLIKMIPELKLNETVIAEGKANTFGSSFPLSLTQKSPDMTAKNSVSSMTLGSYMALMFLGGSISAVNLNSVKNKIVDTKKVLESGDVNQISSLSKDQIVGDILYSGELSYFSHFLAKTYLLSIPQGTMLNLLPSGGSYGYVPKVDYLFGLPNTVEPGAIEMDLNQLMVSSGILNGDISKKLLYTQQVGFLSSILEHFIPEQMFNTANESAEAISSVKSLRLAMELGQKVYRIDQNNVASTINNIHHDNDTMTNIRNAVSSGQIVITHEDPIYLEGWSGAGYIVLDPDTGSGAFLISGGTNGTYYVGLLLGISFIAAINAMALAVVAGPFLIGLMAVIVSQIIIASVIAGMAGVMACFASGLLDGALAMAVSNIFIVKALTKLGYNVVTSVSADALTASDFMGIVGAGVWKGVGGDALNPPCENE